MVGLKLECDVGSRTRFSHHPLIDYLVRRGNDEVVKYLLGDCLQVGNTSHYSGDPVIHNGTLNNLISH